MIFLRSLFFNIFLFGGIAVACIIAFPLLFLKDKHMICAGRILSRYIGFLLKIFIDVKIDFKGTENLNKFEKYFVASAHQSMFETFALQTVISGPVFILKKGLMKIPFFGWCLNCLLYTSDAADEGLGVDLGGRRIIKKNWCNCDC